MPDPTGGDLLDELLPRLTQLGTALQRGDLVERGRIAAGHGLERPSLGVLVTLRLAGTPLRVGEIATRLEVVGPHVTRQVGDLERRGMVRKVTDPADQRARLIEPTAEGTAATERYLGVMFGWFTEALAGWSAEDREQLGRLLSRLVDDLTARGERAGDRTP